MEEHNCLIVPAKTGKLVEKIFKEKNHSHLFLFLKDNNLHKPTYIAEKRSETNFTKTINISFLFVRLKKENYLTRMYLEEK